MKAGGPQQAIEDIKTLAALRRKAFDVKFEKVFGLNQARFDSDPSLKDFQSQGL